MKRAAAAAAVLALLGAAAWDAMPSAGAATVTAQTAGLRLEPLGDSITFGSQSSTGNGYRDPLWQELTGEGHPLDFVGSVREGPMADPDNEGHPGLRIDEIASLTDSSLATYKPNVVTLMAGTNDMVQNFQVSTAPARLSALVDRITTDDPGAVVLVANLIIGTNANIAALEPAYNATIPAMVESKRAAGKHVVFVDMSALRTADLAADGIHPVDSGYQKMADAFNSGVLTADAAGWIVPPSGGTPTASGSGPIMSGIAGKCVDVNGGSSAAGTAVQVWTCNGTTAQRWTPYSDGSLRALGKCLDAVAGGTLNGTKTQLYDCNGTGAQLWQSYHGGYRNLAAGRCLDDPGGSATDGTSLDLWDCDGGTNQQWAPPTPAPITAGTAGKCLDDNAGSANGTKVDLWDCDNTTAQRWRHDNGALQVNGKCLDVIGYGTGNGALVEVWDCSGGTNQVWNVVGNTLVNPASGRCLDDPGYNTSNGTQLDLWDCNGGANQRWTGPVLQ